MNKSHFTKTHILRVLKEAGGRWRVPQKQRAIAIGNANIESYDVKCMNMKEQVQVPVFRIDPTHLM